MFKKIFFLGAVTFTIQVSAQTLSNSPYSRYGVGDVIDGGFAQNFAMGSTGTAYNNPFNVNFTNPASYSSFKLTTFDASASANFVTYSDANTSQNANTSSLSHLVLGLPIVSGKVGASFGLLPYSSSGYNLIGSEVVPNVGTITRTYKGTGGINQFYLGVAYAPKKWVSLGVNAAYLFGSINRERTITFPADSSGFLNTRVMNAVNVGSFLFTYGVQFYKDLPKDYKLTIGISANLQTNIKATNTELVTRYFANNGIEKLRDSLPVESDTKGSIVIPAGLRMGVSVKNSQWMAGIDAGMQQWANYAAFGESDGLKNTKFVGGGIQLTPNENALNSYFKQVQYRFGLKYAQTPLFLEGKQLDERSVTFGAGFPIVKPALYGISYINLGCEIGVHGTRANGLIKENFVKINASFSFSDKWFAKRKYD